MTEKTTVIAPPRELGALEAAAIDTTGGNPTIALVVLAAIVLGALGATVALAWHGTIDGQAAVGIILAVLAGALGASAHAAGTNAGAAAAAKGNS